MSFNYLFAAILLLASIWLLYILMRGKHGDENFREITVTIGGKVHKLEVADTEAKRQKGLMNRAKLESDKGMFFVFDNSGIHPFWMKNTLIALDMIWLNSNKEIVFMYENAQPCNNVIEAVCKSIIPEGIAKYVIELNAGSVEKLELKIGDKVDL